MIRDLKIVTIYPNVTQEQIDQWFKAYEEKFQTKLSDHEREIFLSGKEIRILLDQEPPYERGFAIHQLVKASS